MDYHGKMLSVIWLSITSPAFSLTTLCLINYAPSILNDLRFSFLAHAVFHFHAFLHEDLSF